MSVAATQVSAGTTATALTAADTDTVEGQQVWVRNTDAATTVYLGDATVTTGSGFPVAAMTTVGPFSLSEGEVLYGVASVAAVVAVLRTGA